MTSQEMYKTAYDLHYKRKMIPEALSAYLTVIKDYPGTNEERYARQQIPNILKNIKFNEICIDECLVDLLGEIIDKTFPERKLEFNLAKGEMTSEKISIDNPDEINEQSATNAGPQLYIADELLKLKNLMDLGVLTKDEFDTQKQKLLNGDTNNQTRQVAKSTTIPDVTNKSTEIQLEKVKCPLCGVENSSEANICRVCGFSIKTHIAKEKAKYRDDKVRCPKCGSTAITTGPRGVNFAWGIIGASKTVNRCAKCGHTWKPKG